MNIISQRPNCEDDDPIFIINAGKFEGIHYSYNDIEFVDGTDEISYSFAIREGEELFYSLTSATDHAILNEFSGIIGSYLKGLIQEMVKG